MISCHPMVYSFTFLFTNLTSGVCEEHAPSPGDVIRTVMGRNRVRVFLNTVHITNVAVLNYNNRWEEDR